MESIQQVIDRFDFQARRRIAGPLATAISIQPISLPLICRRAVSSGTCCRKSITMYFVTLTG